MQKVSLIIFLSAFVFNLKAQITFKKTYIIDDSFQYNIQF
jgi:hypothetical protein